MSPDLAHLSLQPLAHLGRMGTDQAVKGHDLQAHLREVARRAGELARAFGAQEAAQVAGLWHDLGKYSRDFQEMIRSAHGLSAHLEDTPDADHPERFGMRDHSTAGAIHAVDTLGEIGKLVAFAIAGHHAGLSDESALDARLADAGKRALYQHTVARAHREILDGIVPPVGAPAGRGNVARRKREMWTRMLFSALCDADFLDTEAFFRPEQAGLRSPAIEPSVLRDALDAYCVDLEQKAKETPSAVNQVRRDVRQACIAASGQPGGVYSLTVPTGGGKTLAGLTFALHHAVRHGLDRVIVGIPFTSIIEQTAAKYREVFAALPPGVVLEHHCHVDPDKETPQNRVASENWDAPIVVTTNVQLFESLFANRPGRCRKLHRLARSVIVLDETQSLPPELLAPILDMLETLVSDFGVTLVFSTATQPGFQKKQMEEVGGIQPGFADVREIIPDEVAALDRLRRVEVQWPARLDAAVTWEGLAEEMRRVPDVLAIVHKRQDARDLCAALDAASGPGEEPVLHLSARMCAAHRSQVLAEVHARKKAKRAVRLVSTQLVEAGVDVDFAVVYRALGGLDALAQAAGRCNREGELPTPGQLRVYVAPTAPPRGVPTQGLAITKGLLAKGALDLNDPKLFRTYFQRLYRVKNLDEKGILDLRARMQFATVAREFSLIDDEGSEPIVVRHGAQIGDWLDELERDGPTRQRLQRLQRHTVLVRADERARWLSAGWAEWVASTVVVIRPEYSVAYDRRFGLCVERMGQITPSVAVC